MVLHILVDRHNVIGWQLVLNCMRRSSTYYYLESSGQVACIKTHLPWRHPCMPISSWQCWATLTNGAWCESSRCTPSTSSIEMRASSLRWTCTHTPSSGGLLNAQVDGAKLTLMGFFPSVHKSHILPISHCNTKWKHLEFMNRSLRAVRPLRQSTIPSLLPLNSSQILQRRLYFIFTSAGM
jgi:hypothetical protein